MIRYLRTITCDHCDRPLELNEHEDLTGSQRPHFAADWGKSQDVQAIAVRWVKGKLVHGQIIMHFCTDCLNRTELPQANDPDYLCQKCVNKLIEREKTLYGDTLADYDETFTLITFADKYDPFQALNTLRR